MKNNPLLDKDFLVELDKQKNKEIYAKVVSLTFDELPIEEITGKVTGGSINIDGTSVIRRSCSVNLIAENVNISDYYWGVNTKFQLFIGIKNNVDPEYDNIIWFKQGTFLITNFSTSLQTNNYNISIQGKDKMCLLNGDIAGIIESLTVDFGKYEQIDENGNIIIKKYLLKEILKEAIHQYAKEPYGNIIIKDLDMTGLELLEYRGNQDLFLLIKDDLVTGYRFENDSNNGDYYLYNNDNEENRESINIEELEQYDERISKTFGENLKAATKICTVESGPADAWTVARIRYGETCGYRETELTYTDDLIANVGESLTSSLLDKIVKMLGEYEYFYDVDGHFVFQQKATYNNNSWNSIQNSNDPENLYVENAAYTSAMTYSFLDSNLITAFQNTPNITNLKNDFSIWGTKKINDNEIPIHLRYAIDEKPVYYKAFDNKVYITKQEYNRLKSLNSLTENNPTIIIDLNSQFKRTPLPEGLDDGWWEIDDWTRRYLYFADVDNIHDINYYLNLTGQEVTNIISRYQNITLEDPTKHNFDYYVKYLANSRLTTFGTQWATADWLNIFPQPMIEEEHDSFNYNKSKRYYDSMIAAAIANKSFWCWMFDTDYSPETKKEYICSIEHGNVSTQKDGYPGIATNFFCQHYFSFPYTDSHRKQNNPNYHVYIYNPDIPDTLKNDGIFQEKEEYSDFDFLKESNYFVCDWREIIYQMAYDYYHYQHNDNFTATIAKNNKNYYPDGFTKYEQYYLDIYSFWRDLYNPFSKGLESHVVDMNLPTLYQWDNNLQDFSEIDLTSENYVKISIPQDVVNTDGEFYFLSGRNKYTPYIVSVPETNYYKQELFKDLSFIRYDPIQEYSKQSLNSSTIEPCTENNDIGYKKVKLSNSTYQSNTYYTLSGSNYILDPEYKSIELTENEYVPAKYYIEESGIYKIDNNKNFSSEKNYYIKNTFDENIDYFEKSLFFQIGYKYYLDSKWQKINNFGAGISYYTQNYYLPVSSGGQYNYDSETNIVSPNGSTYKEVDAMGPNVIIAYKEEIYVDPNIQYFDFLTTSSMNIFSKVSSFLKGKKYYYQILRPATKDDTDLCTITSGSSYSKDYFCYGQANNGDIILYKQDPNNEQNIYYMIDSIIDPSKQLYTKEYVWEESINFSNRKAYYTLQSINDREIIDLTQASNDDYYYVEGNEFEKINESNYTYDKNKEVIKGNIMRFFPGDIYYRYHKENYENIDNGYYFIKTDYYKLQTSAVFDMNLSYFYDTYGTVAAITKQEYQPNKFYIHDNTNQMFNKYNILHYFKRGYDYYIIENEDNKSLIFDKNYLLATFYPKESTIFYILKNNDFIPISLTEEEFYNNQKEYILSSEPFDSKNTYYIDSYGTIGAINENNYTINTYYIKNNKKDYYIAYGKYNYYYYTENILNNFVFLFKSYNKNNIYYQYNSEQTLEWNQQHLKENYIGKITEDKWNNNCYIITTEITFLPSTEYNSNKKYYSIPALDLDYYEENMDEEQWNDKLYELINESGIYLSNDFYINSYWSIKTKNPEQLIFWFDFLDISTGGDLAQYSAHLIGDRPKSINDNDVKSIYYRDVPTVIFKDNNSAYVKVFINEEKFKSAGTLENPDIYYIYDEKNDTFNLVTNYDETVNHYIINIDGSKTNVGSNNYYDTINIYQADINNNDLLVKKYSPVEDYYRRWNYTKDGKTGYTYVNIIQNLNNLFSISSQKKSTFDTLDNFLYNNSYCVETISISAIPIYHLSPNTRIFVRDDSTGINGEYIVSKISIPLTYNGTMNITATKAVKRIY